MLNFKNVVSVKIPEGSVKKITANGIVLWKKPVKNWVSVSIDSTGAIFNETGYKVGCRIRSNGEESSNSDVSCTGYIPISPGDTIRIYPAFTRENVANAVNYSDENFANLGQLTYNTATGTALGYGICETNTSPYDTTEVDGVSVVTATDVWNTAIKYIRVTNKSTVGYDIIVTINEEIEQ